MTRVLVVEDEESYSDALGYMLRKEGFEVAIAATGPDALTEFDRNGADIVLLDLMLPGLPGTEVCRQIRATSNVPVIMVSARGEELDRVLGLELGADEAIGEAPVDRYALGEAARAAKAPASSAGHSLIAAPSPLNVPASQGRRASASTAPPASTAGTMSKRT